MACVNTSPWNSHTCIFAHVSVQKANFCEEYFMTARPSSEYPPSRLREWATFFFVTIILLPGLAVAFVGTYGFVVWMTHIINGPPTVGL